MSQQYTLQIENFSGDQNLIIDINSFHFSQSPHLPTTSVRLVEVKKIAITRSADKYSPLFIIARNADQSFPKAVIQVKSSGGGKSHLFTFLKVYVDDYIPGDNNLEQFVLVFDEYSYKEISPVGNTAKPNRVKTSDKHHAAVMNFVKG